MPFSAGRVTGKFGMWDEEGEVEDPAGEEMGLEVVEREQRLRDVLAGDASDRILRREDLSRDGRARAQCGDADDQSRKPCRPGSRLECAPLRALDKPQSSNVDFSPAHEREKERRRSLDDRN